MRYGVQRNGSTQSLNISRVVTITGLDAATKYSIEVAAMNSAGTGVYSDPISIITSGKNLLKYAT